MEKEILEILKAMQQDIKGLKDEQQKANEKFRQNWKENWYNLWESC